MKQMGGSFDTSANGQQMQDGEAQPTIFTGFDKWVLPHGYKGAEPDAIQGPNRDAVIGLELADGKTLAVTRSQLWMLVMRLSSALDRTQKAEVSLGDGRSFKDLNQHDLKLLKGALDQHPDKNWVSQPQQMAAEP